MNRHSVNRHDVHSEFAGFSFQRAELPLTLFLLLQGGALTAIGFAFGDQSIEELGQSGFPAIILAPLILLDLALLVPGRFARMRSHLEWDGLPVAGH